MIGNLHLYGLMSLVLACAAAIIFSFLALACLLIHYGLWAKGEAWPAASPIFRVFLSAGTLVILNLATAAAWFVVILPASEEFRQWSDNVFIYGWAPLVILIFLVIYFGLKVLIPILKESSFGRFAIIAWAGISGTLSALVAVSCFYVIVLSLFSP